MQPMRFDETRSEYGESLDQRRTLRRGRGFAVAVHAGDIVGANTSTRARVRHHSRIRHSRCHLALTPSACVPSSQHHHASIAPLCARSYLHVRNAKRLRQLTRPKRHRACNNLRACSNLRACNVTRSRQPWSWQRPGRPPSSRRCGRECSRTPRPRCCATR